MLNFNSFAFCTGNFFKFQIHLFYTGIKTIFSFQFNFQKRGWVKYTSGVTYTIQRSWPWKYGSPYTPGFTIFIELPRLSSLLPIPIIYSPTIYSISPLHTCVLQRSKWNENDPWISFRYDFLKIITRNFHFLLKHPCGGSPESLI